jgi:hypothetical protein
MNVLKGQKLKKNLSKSPYRNRKKLTKIPSFIGAERTVLFIEADMEIQNLRNVSYEFLEIEIQNLFSKIQHLAPFAFHSDFGY